MDRLKDEKFAEFYKLYIKTIANDYAKLENIRDKCIIQNIIFAIGAFVLTSVFIIYAMYDSPVSCVIFCVCILFLVLFGCLFSADKQFKIKLKMEILPYILSALGNIKFEKMGTDTLENHLDYIDDKNFRDSGLFLEYGKCSIDDIINGQYNNVKFRVVETRLYSEINKSYNTLFKGIILTYKFNKIIKNKTIVAFKNAFTQKSRLKLTILKFLTLFIPASLFGSGFIWSCFGIADTNWLIKIAVVLLANIFILIICLIFSISIFVKYFKTVNNLEGDFFEKVILEDPKFNKKFNVYSSDQVEARYLVTPLFMEKFYNLKTVFGAKNIRCSFFEDNLMIAIETKKDLFELGNLFKPVKDVKTIENFYDEITAIFDMIDYFKLNEDIYLK